MASGEDKLLIELQPIIPDAAVDGEDEAENLDDEKAMEHVHLLSDQVCSSSIVY